MQGPEKYQIVQGSENKVYTLELPQRHEKTGRKRHIMHNILTLTKHSDLEMLGFGDNRKHTNGGTCESNHSGLN